MKKTILAIIVLLFFAFNHLTAQNVFPEKFDSCNTDMFALENDSVTAKHNSIEFVEGLQKYIGAEAAKKIRGKIQIQIIVDVQGNSCLLSLENGTNIKTKKLNLKPWIDQNVKWKKPFQKVSAIVVLEFNDFGTLYRRLGMNANKGWHFIE